MRKRSRLLLFRAKGLVITITQIVSEKMYRVITYRSRPLKKNTIKLEATGTPVAAFDEPVKQSGNKNATDIKAEKKTRKELRQEKKELKAQKKSEREKIYIIDDVEVREEDLTADERADIEANAILNIDGFYTALKPLDYYENEEIKNNKPNKLMIAVIVLGMIACVAAVSVVLFIL